MYSNFFPDKHNHNKKKVVLLRMNDVNVQRCFKYLGNHASVKMYFLKISLVDIMLFGV